MIHSISEFFRSHGLDPMVGGFIAGALLALIARAGAAVNISAGEHPLSGRAAPPPTKPGSLPLGTSTVIKITVEGIQKELDAQSSADIVSALERGDKIEAIKILRESSGLDLKGAKDIIDVMARSRPS